MKPVLYVDNDNVMADSMVWWIKLYNHENHSRYTVDDFTEWSLDRFPGMGKHFTNYEGVQPVRGALKSIATLEKKYRIVFATAGFGSHWLKKRIPTAEIVHITDKSLLRGFAMIDDYPLNLDGFQGFRYLFSQPWNRNRGLNEVTWEPIVEHLMSMEANYERYNPAR
jgi:Uncharacterized protein conserved in bacteria